MTLVEFYNAVLAGISSFVAVDEGGEKRLDVIGYSEFAPADLRRLALLVEFEGVHDEGLASDGRRRFVVDAVIHAVVPGHSESALLAMDLCMALACNIDSKQRWGLPGGDVLRPEVGTVAPTLFNRGKHPYEAWGVPFSQEILVGEGFKDQVVNQVFVHYDQAGNPDDLTEYQQFVTSEGV